MNDLEDAKAKVASLFHLTSINRIICVDDSYEITQQKLKDAVVLSANQSENLHAIEEFREIEFSIDPETYRYDLDQAIDNLSENRLVEIYRNIKVFQPNIISTYMIETLLQDHEFIPLTLPEWNANKEILLSDGREVNTIFLFDQNLGYGHADEGMKIIEAINNDSIICGLLSSTFEPEDEYTRWNEYAEHYIIEKSRFLLISKKHQNYSSIAAMIKLVTLNRFCEELKDKVQEIIIESQQETFDKVKKIDVYDFEHMIFTTSLTEGIWEIDTLLRLNNIYQRSEVLRMARENNTTRQLADNIKGTIDINLEKKHEKSNIAKKIMHMERFEDTDYLNTHHLALDLGDIFHYTLNNANKYFILLAQPCDLMVRAGKRARTYETTLARIKIKPNDYTHAEDEYLLLYFNNESENKYIVDLKDTVNIKLSVLDLCVFNTSGETKLVINSPAPITLSKSWVQRYEKITEYFNKYTTIYINNANALKESPILKLILPSASQSTDYPFNPHFSIPRNEINYGFKRILRLRQPASGELLTRYTRLLSRMAFEHQLDRDDTP